MIFLLREMFKRRGMEGYKAAHHYADIGITAGAGAVIAFACGTDTASARYYFENALFLGGAASVLLAFRTATASEPDSKSVRVLPYVTKLAGGAVLGVAVAATPLMALPGTEGMSLKERILQDNTDYVPLRKRQKAAEKAAKLAAEEAAKAAEQSGQTAPVDPATKPEDKNVSHETIQAPVILVVPQKRGLGL